MFNYLILLETEQEKVFFQEIYKKYRSDMFHTAYGILKNESDAEDIVHETFLSIIDNLEKIMGKKCHEIWSYIVTIVRNKSINLYNQKKRHRTKQLEDWAELEVFAPDTYVEIAQKETAMELADLLEQMNTPYKEVLVLQYYHQLSAEEIGRIIGKSADNVRHISQRARRKLQKLLEERGQE